jgi:predicted O-methyltransferase YrrM
MTSEQSRWTAVDDYFAGALAREDAALVEAIRSSDAAGLPPHAVSPTQGKLLSILARMVGARAILEIGTLGGYSTIWLARALPEGGCVVTLEANPKHAEVARANLARAGVAAAVDVRVGRAADSLARLVDEGGGPFDLVFIDADKPSNPEYLAWSLKLVRAGSILVADNVVRGGAVADAASDDPNVRGVRRFTELVADEPRLDATALQTVGCKGWDGFALALVLR